MSRKRIVLLVVIIGLLCLVLFLSSGKNPWGLVPASESESEAVPAGSRSVLNERGAASPTLDDSLEAGNTRSISALKRGGGDKLESFRMRGRVTTEDKQPVSGAEIVVCQSLNRQDCPGSPWRAVSGKDGFYILSLPLKRGTDFLIRVSGHGYASLEGRLTMEAPADLDRDFVLEPALAWVRGRVVDPTGAPVEGSQVVVAARGRRPDAAGGRGIGMAYVGGKREYLVTDGAGDFGADGFALGSAMVSAHASGYRSSALEVELEPGENRVDLRLQPARIVPIRVVNRRGDPIEGATAICRNFRERGVENEISGPGLVTLKLDPQIAECTCEFRAPTYLTGYVAFRVDSPPGEVVLEDGPVVRVRVVNQSGEPVQGARVSWRRDQQGARGNSGAGGVTDATGNLAIPVSTDESVTLVASAAGYLNSNAWIQTVDHAARTIVLKRPEGALTGRVIDPSGNPVTSFYVTVFSTTQSDPSDESRGGGGRPDFSTSGQFQHRDGWFSFPELPSGDLVVHVMNRGMQKSESVHIPAGMTANVLIQLEPVRRGRRE